MKLKYSIIASFIVYINIILKYRIDLNVNSKFVWKNWSSFLLKYYTLILISDFKLDSMFINNNTENNKSNSDVSTKYVVSLAYFKGINSVTSVKEQ